MSNEHQFVMETVLGRLDVSEELDFKSATSCVQHMGKLFLDILVARGIGTIVDNDVAWAIDIDILEERIIDTSNVLFLKKIFEIVMEDDDLISELLGDCEVGVNILRQIYTHYQAEDIKSSSSITNSKIFSKNNTSEVPITRSSRISIAHVSTISPISLSNKLFRNNFPMC